jgi:hypothetical protein
VSSAYGGGNIGHLAMVLTNADYIARVDVPFVVPLHPGPPPDAALISVALSNYAAALNNVTSYNSLFAALKPHILSEVTASFLGALKDPDLGFKDVTPNMASSPPKSWRRIVPLCLNSGTWTIHSKTRGPPKLPTFNQNCQHSTPRNVWQRAVPDITIMTLTLAMFEQTGLLATTTEKFCL